MVDYHANAMKENKTKQHNNNRRERIATIP
jgi:hypothetical protein